MTNTTEIDSSTHTDIPSINNTMGDDVVKPSDTLSSPKPTLLPAPKIHPSMSPPDSLRRMFTSGSPLKSSRPVYPIDFDMLKKRVESKIESTEQPSVFDLYGYGYGYGPDEGNSPKQRENVEGGRKRQFERRNSKTSRMMMLSMKTPFLLDFLDDKKDLESTATDSATTGSDSSKFTLSPRSDSGALSGFDAFDRGIDIAEDLVKQLQKQKQKRKRSTKN